MYLGFDLGTSSVKAVVADETGRIVASGASPVERRCMPDGGVEQDIEQIWEAASQAIWQSTRDLGAAAIRDRRSSQGGALQLLDGQERPVGAVISWLDGRGRPFDRELAAELGEDFSPSTSATAPAP